MEWRKITFKVTFDKECDIHYVELVVDGETKKHKEEDSDTDSPFMPEIKDSKYCPVISYLTYYMSLSRDSPYLWQQPKFRHTDTFVSTYMG